MKLEPWWYARRPVTRAEPLEGNATCDVAVVGGGFAGLHAALQLARQGVQVVLLEKTFCGGSSSGLSSGFITPDSELPLHQLIRRYGSSEAAALWGVAVSGVDLIAATAAEYRIDCDFEEQDSLFVAIDASGAERVEAEAHARGSLGYKSTSYNRQELLSVHAGDYAAGVRYPGTFAIDPFSYCQGLRSVLLEMGVRIHEYSEVLTITGRSAITASGSVTADHILVCIDKLARHFNSRAYRKYYYARTWLAISEPLVPEQVRAIFPEERLQCWDSKMIYTYYRLAGENRLLVGGGSALTTFLPGQDRSQGVINSVLAEFKERFPFLAQLEFSSCWSGRIDITGDLLPLADFDPDNSAVHYVMGCAGLPWAAWCGDQAARKVSGKVAEDYSRFFGWKRKLLVSDQLQRVLGKIPSFTLNYFYAKR